MDKVRMTHPDLPDQPIDVLPIAVAQHEASGWVQDGETHDDGTRRIAAQTPTQQPPPLSKPAGTTTPPKSGKDGAES